LNFYLNENKFFTLQNKKNLLSYDTFNYDELLKASSSNKKKMYRKKSRKAKNIVEKLNEMTPSTPNSSSSLKESTTADKNSTANVSLNNNNNNSDSLSSSFLSQLDSSSSQTLMGSSSSSTPNKCGNKNKKTSNSDLSTQNVKFQSTIDLVGIYLQKVVKLQFPFENKEQNKLTYAVFSIYYFLRFSFLKDFNY
jgi:hypothetical protein